MPSPPRPSAATRPPSWGGLVVGAVLISGAVRAVFLLVFALLAFVSFVFIPGSGSFVGVYFFGGTFLLPVLVPTAIFIRTQQKARGGPGSPTAFALLAAGLALLVIVVPIPDTGPTALKYVKLPHLSLGITTEGSITDPDMYRPRNWALRLLDECQSSNDCLKKHVWAVCAPTELRHVCIATTKAGPSGCPPGWSCAEIPSVFDRGSHASECIPPGEASRFRASSTCESKKPLRDFGQNRAD